MINVMLDPLPEEWNGYEVNTSFRIGIQVYIAQYDKDMNDFEKMDVITHLLFDDRDHPYGEELDQCIAWFLNGWYTDNVIPSKDKRRLVDYDVDQWRIYADFRQIYGINLNDLGVEPIYDDQGHAVLDENGYQIVREVDMHWWMFNGLLWNMPYKMSSFMEVIDIRKKKITSEMRKKEREAIAAAQKIYSIDQPEQKKEYSPEEAEKIDEYDRMMADIKAKKQAEKEALQKFRKG